MFEAFLIEEGERKGYWGVLFMNDNYPWIVIFNPVNMRVYGEGGIVEAIMENELGRDDLSGAVMHTKGDPSEHLNKEGRKADGQAAEFMKNFKLKPRL